MKTYKIIDEYGREKEYTPSEAVAEIKVAETTFATVENTETVDTVKTENTATVEETKPKTTKK